MNKLTPGRALYEARDFPVFQNRMYDSAAGARACPKGDIRLVQDHRTGLVRNQAFRPELMTYDRNYQNEQAVSTAFRTHLEQVAGIVDRAMKGKSIVEVGCGKGFFLEMLLSRGFDVVGFDPTYEGDNPRVVRRYFDATSGVRSGALVLRHVLEHVPEPYRFLLSLREANGGGGRIYIEVPCFDWINRHGAWFDIFYEHVNYFRLADFQRMFGRLEESGHLFGGQYLYVVADLSTIREPRLDPADEVQLEEDFTASLTRGDVRHPDGCPTAIWGGASKGVIFALLRERIGCPVDIVIDVNPAKQGKFLPGSGLLVNSPSEALPRLPAGATIFVMNSNYLREIREMSGNAYRYIGVDHG
jgi:SAM-dependent methyltransferase